MIRITVQDLHKESPRCPPKCVNYKVEGCGNCLSRFRVAFECPHCKSVRAFYGGNSPYYCASCHRPLRDFHILSITQERRVEYHQEKAI